MNITEARSPNKELDAIEEKLRKEINKAYKQALKEMTDKFNDATKEFAKLDKKKRQEVKDGKLSDREYKAWRKEQLMTKKWMMDMIAEISNKCTEATQKSAEIINDHLPQAYASGHNRGAYEIETGINASTSMTLIPTRAVRNAVDEGKVLYPKSKVKIPKDRAWNAKHLKAEIAQGIIQGESIDEIAKRLGKVAAMSASTAMRMARTMTGCAMNMGHFDSAKEAQDLGIEVEKVWIATPDLRTRDSHRHMDLERVPLDDKFSNGLMFPKDPEGAPAEVYNCRCRIVNLPEGIDLDLQDRFERLPEGMTYDQWKQGKQKQMAGNTADIVQQTLKNIETNSRYFNYEQGTIVDKHGNVLLNIDGKEHEVDISDDDFKLLKGNIFTHNHPNGGFITDNDILTGFVKGGLSELRASTPQGVVHVIKSNGSTEESAKQFLANFNEARKKGNRTAQEHILRMLKMGKISEEEYKRNYYRYYLEWQDEVVMNFVKNKGKDYGFEYSVEMLDE